MLSRTASGLYWMARYLERAEQLARVLDVTNRLSLMPVRGDQGDDLLLPLNLTGTRELFETLNGRFTMPQLFNFFALDDRNPCSIFSCWQEAWNNAHAVRGSLSSEVWESINSTWIEMRNTRRRGITSANADSFFDWVKERSHLFRGAMFGTLLRGDAMSFIRIGTLMERSDGTARLLSVNQQLLEQQSDSVREYYRLDTLLRAVSAREAYNAIFKQQLLPHLVNEMLILRSESPRSLHSCIDEIATQLEQIGSSGEDRPRYLITVLLAEMRFSTWESLTQEGLTHWLNEFLTRLNALADSINHTYLEAK
ncbi:alpha-E domain-containing protein [Pantoea sp. B9002]|uniref:alpha-E domain-containing protein n=1 Tax=Pantoea sp. B9002 TaxID=2726979 RepID=UPI0015A35ECA|nr:alpha-E domain-containing protein [Pantoea sp. B9002]NWA61763.1 alpha-E domain-containing protein [Pantoea sp. B9002]